MTIEEKSETEKYVVYNATYGGFALSEKALTWLEERAVSREEMGYQGTDMDRHDQLLALCVMTLGSEANGVSASLKVHRLTDEKYWIDEYDGSESVVEPSTMRWITAE